MKKALTEEYFRDYWLKKYHGIDSKWLVENKLSLIGKKEWIEHYPVTQAQHDEWHEWCIKEVQKHHKCSSVKATRLFVFVYFFLAPYVKTE